jgi:hypothetical protein
MYKIPGFSTPTRLFLLLRAKNAAFIQILSLTVNEFCHLPLLCASNPYF